MHVLPEPDILGARRRLIFMAVVAALHLLLAWWLLGTQKRRPPDPLRMAVSLVPIQAAPPRPAQQAPRMPGSIPSPSGVRTNAVTPPSAEATALASGEAPALADPAAAVASAPPGPAALDAGATARAIREAARNPTLAYRARVRDGKAPATLGERLEAGVTSAGRRDCLNANVNPGAQGDSTLKHSPIPVGGLLAAPFIVADALLGKCGL